MEIPFTSPSYVRMMQKHADLLAAGKHSDLRAIHVGVSRANIEQAKRLHNIAVNGDGWNVWGEPLGAEENDSSTLHVVALTEHRDFVLGMIKLPMNLDLLVPDLGGGLVVESDPVEWADGALILDVVSV